MTERSGEEAHPTVVRLQQTLWVPAVAGVVAVGAAVLRPGAAMVAAAGFSAVVFVTIIAAWGWARIGPRPLSSTRLTRRVRRVRRDLPANLGRISLPLRGDPRHIQGRGSIPPATLHAIRTVAHRRIVRRYGLSPADEAHHNQISALVAPELWRAVGPRKLHAPATMPATDLPKIVDELRRLRSPDQ